MGRLANLRHLLAKWLFPSIFVEADELRSRLSEASTARVVAEDNARFWQEQHGEMQTRLDEAHETALAESHRLTDVLAQQRYGQQIYGTFEIPAVTPGSQRPVQRTGIQARALVNRQRHQTISQIIGGVETTNSSDPEAA